MLKFYDLDCTLLHCRQLIPVFGTAVHYSKPATASSYMNMNNDDYVVRIMEQSKPFFVNKGVSHLFSSAMVRGSGRKCNGALHIHALIGDYPSMLRDTNTRQGRCVFCWYKRGVGGEQRKKVGSEEVQRHRNCVKDVCTKYSAADSCVLVRVD